MLNLSDQRTRNILSTSPAIIYSCRAYGDFGATFVSENITTRFGYSTQECLENPNFWRENIHPNDCPYVFEKFDSIFKKGHHVHEYRFRKKDGSYVWIFDEVRLIRDSDGSPVEIVGSWLDITTRKTAEASLQKSEALFRDFFQTNPAATIISSLSGLVHMINPAFTNTTGFSSKDAVGRTVQELGFWPELDDREHMLATIKECGFIDNIEGNYYCKNRRPITCLVSSRAIEYEGDLGLLSIVIDITKQKKAEEAMRKLDKIKSEFISTAAHELRTPLTSIMGFTEMISDQTMVGHITEEQKKEMLDDILDNSERLSKIIDDLLDIGRIEAGHDIPLNKKLHSIKDLLGKIVRRYELKAGHQVTLDIESGVSETLEFDMYRIEQAIENLLSNAIKYSPEESTITIVAECVDRRCQVTVIDQGIGMSEEQSARVFDKFYRANASDSAIAGFGLGMSIVKKIVEDHGGKIWVDSELGKGTQVRFTLPK